MMRSDIVLDDGEPTGAIVQRLTEDETAALIDGLSIAEGRLRRSDPEAGRAFNAVARKVCSLIGNDVCGLEIHVVRAERHGL
jgi:hypothetical protein